MILNMHLALGHDVLLDSIVFIDHTVGLVIDDSAVVKMTFRNNCEMTRPKSAQKSLFESGCFKGLFQKPSLKEKIAVVWQTILKYFVTRISRLECFLIYINK